MTDIYRLLEVQQQIVDAMPHDLWCAYLANELCSCNCTRLDLQRELFHLCHLLYDGANLSMGLAFAPYEGRKHANA